MHKGFGNSGDLDGADREILTHRDHEVHDTLGGLPDPARQARSVGECDLDLAAAGPPEVLLGGQRPVDAAGGHLQHVRAVVSGGLLSGIQGRRGDFRQGGDGIQIDTVLGVGDHGEPRRTATAEHHIFDFIAGPGELAVKEFDHLLPRR